jgi:hypothetical protein
MVAGNSMVGVIANAYGGSAGSAGLMTLLCTRRSTSAEVQQQ